MIANLHIISELANRIYWAGPMPELIVIPKNEGEVECNKHRTISAKSQILKIILQVLNQRFKRKVEETVKGVQFSFMKGVGTRKPTSMLIMIMDRAIEKHKDFFIRFVDFENAFAEYVLGY